MGTEKFASTGIRSPYLTACSASNYRLSCPGLALGVQSWPILFLWKGYQDQECMESCCHVSRTSSYCFYLIRFAEQNWTAAATSGQAHSLFISRLGRHGDKGGRNDVCWENKVWCCGFPLGARVESVGWTVNFEVKFNHKLTRHSHTSTAERYTLSHNSSPFAEQKLIGAIRAFKIVTLQLTCALQSSDFPQLSIKHRFK